MTVQSDVLIGSGDQAFSIGTSFSLPARIANGVPIGDEPPSGGVTNG